jgi:hypothetical protein
MPAPHESQDRNMQSCHSVRSKNRVWTGQLSMAASLIEKSIRVSTLSERTAPVGKNSQSGVAEKKE